MIETPELKQAKAEIKRLNEELEEEVEERTRELASTNEALKRQILERKALEQQARSLIDAIPHQIWSGPADGTLDYCNDRWRAYMGLEQKDLCGDGWQSMLHPDDRDRVLKAWHESVVNGTPYEEEERHRGADGTYRWFLARGVPWRDTEGRIVRWYGTNTDIEDRKQAEEALRESEIKFRRLLASNIIGVVFWTLGGDILETNDLFLSIVGYTREDLRQGDLSWKKLTPPEYAQADEKAIGELKATGTCAPFEKEYIRKDGSRVSVLIGSALLEPKRDAGSSFVMDITERKEAEERLRRSEEKFKALFRIAPVGISVLDGQHNLVDANPALEQITRLSKEELLNGIYRRRTYLNADGTPKPHNQMASARAIAENRPLNDVETGIVTENGEIIWTQVSVAPLALPDASAVVITQDITERKQAEQALRESKERFRELTENIDEVFWLSDPRDTAILYVSPAYEKLWGRSCDSLYASSRSWIEAIHPEDKERVVQILADHELQTAPDMVYRIIRPDGSTRWVHARGFPVYDANGAVVRIAGIAEDITERQIGDKWKLARVLSYAH